MIGHDDESTWTTHDAHDAHDAHAQHPHLSSAVIMAPPSSPRLSTTDPEEVSRAVSRYVDALRRTLVNESPPVVDDDDAGGFDDDDGGDDDDGVLVDALGSIITDCGGVSAAPEQQHNPSPSSSVAAATQQKGKMNSLGNHQQRQPTNDRVTVATMKRILRSPSASDPSPAPPPPIRRVSSVGEPIPSTPMTPTSPSSFVTLDASATPSEIIQLPLRIANESRAALRGCGGGAKGGGVILEPRHTLRLIVPHYSLSSSSAGVRGGNASGTFSAAAVASAQAVRRLSDERNVTLLRPASTSATSGLMPSTLREQRKVTDSLKDFECEETFCDGGAGGVHSHPP